MWLETNGAELSGTSFTKGCYTGQENVARMHYRDKLRRRLLPFAVGDDPPPGPIMAGERVAAELCGAPHQGMQMALARVEHLGSPLTLGGRPVAPVRPPWLSLAEA
jgi:folate-binding Fe-S cluster repair protein YgfZ